MFFKINVVSLNMRHEAEQKISILKKELWVGRKEFCTADYFFVSVSIIGGGGSKLFLKAQNRKCLSVCQEVPITWWKCYFRVIATFRSCL